MPDERGEEGRKKVAVAEASKIPGDIQPAPQPSTFMEKMHPQTPPERNGSGKSSPFHRQLQEAAGGGRGRPVSFIVFFSFLFFEFLL